MKTILQGQSVAALSVVFFCLGSLCAQEPPRRRTAEVLDVNGTRYQVAQAWFAVQCIEFGLDLPHGHCAEFLMSQSVRVAVPLASLVSIECQPGQETDIPWDGWKISASVAKMPFCRVTHAAWGREVTFRGKLEGPLLGTAGSEKVALDTEIKQVIFVGPPEAYETPAPPRDAVVTFGDSKRTTLRVGGLRPTRREFSTAHWYKWVGPSGESAPFQAGAAFSTLHEDYVLKDGSRLALAELRSIEFQSKEQAIAVLRDGRTRELALASDRLEDSLEIHCGVTEYGYARLAHVKKIEFSGAK